MVNSISTYRHVVLAGRACATFLTTPRLRFVLRAAFPKRSAESMSKRQSLFPLLAYSREPSSTNLT